MTRKDKTTEYLTKQIDWGNTSIEEIFAIPLFDYIYQVKAWFKEKKLQELAEEWAYHNE